MNRVRQTTCIHCGQDIENAHPFRPGTWRDRGSNTHCPTPAGDAGQLHEPVKGKPTPAAPTVRHTACTQIAALLDGTEWGVDTLDRIAEIVRAAGFQVRDTP